MTALPAAPADILAAVGIEPCGDSSCIFGRPRGMATNGGCRCAARAEERHELRNLLRKTAHALRMETADAARWRQARAILRETAERLAAHDDDARPFAAPAIERAAVAELLGLLEGVHG